MIDRKALWISILIFLAVTAVTNAGDPGRAIVMSPSVQAESQSNLPRSALPIVADAPGIARDAEGKPLAEGEASVSLPMTNKVTHPASAMTLRGLGPQSIKLRVTGSTVLADMEYSYHTLPAETLRQINPCRERKVQSD